MSVFNALEFDGINSLDYGIYITGEAAFNSPQRAVESVTVPGRNGDILLDQGHYENIEVIYRAGVFGADQTEFASKIQAFRNLLASRIGYKRITDTYNTGEYRLGTFIAPVDVLPDSYNRVGEFDIVFNCKPQRFLTSGETAVTVENGDIITNPTRFDAQPLLAVEGYGTIAFNGFDIELTNDVYGVLPLYEYTNDTVITTKAIKLPINPNYVNVGDSINVDAFSIKAWYRTDIYRPSREVFYDATVTGDGTVTGAYSLLSFNFQFDSCTFTAGTDAQIAKTMTSATIRYRTADNTLASETTSGSATIAYDSSTSTITISVSGFDDMEHWHFEDIYIKPLIVVLNSTATILGHPTYVDCELGEAYKVENGEYISLNEYIDLGSDLPTLASGQNIFDVDNTITDLQITPRWWII